MFGVLRSSGEGFEGFGVLEWVFRRMFLFGVFSFYFGDFT